MGEGCKNYVTSFMNDPLTFVSQYIQATAHKTKDVKVLVTIGGRDDSYADELSKMSSNPDTRFEFVSSVLNFIEDHNFDGLDLTWLPLGCWEVIL